ncbi:MAG: hypothetical protein LQ349_001645 [Xanthoria aureola]|nr:MAG: hypothetical protein LQ349_001645 [Xanthoria aureola]
MSAPTTTRSPVSPSLPHETSNLSDYTVDSNTTFFDTPATAHTPGSPVHHRSGYRRVASFTEQDTAYHGPEDSRQRSGSVQGQGLGIKNLKPLPSASPGDSSNFGTPSSSNALLSPPFARTPPPLQSYTSYRQSEDPIREEADAWHNNGPAAEQHQPFTADSETESLRKTTHAPTVQSSGAQEPWCKTKRRLHHGKGNWLAISVMILSFYSTALSGLWLGTAIAKPRFGHGIVNNGKLTPATASLIAAAIAKSIELSFVTVFVTFLGQVLSRRALVKKSRGITIAEMSFRSWIMQPGTLITHWATVRYAALTFLGLFSLLCAVTATFYTTASDALVSPQLTMGPLKQRMLYGKVASSFANNAYIKTQCNTPISTDTDPDSSGSTCVAIEHNGQAYHNYMQYLSNWTISRARGTGSNQLSQRPIPLGMLYDNTTIEGSWIHMENMTETSQKYSPDDYARIVMNVTMAMPHAGVFAATRDPINNIMQPLDLNGLGEYIVQASVPSPVTNVLCATMRKEELAPMVYTDWPGSNGTASNLTGWPNGFGIPLWPSYLNSTPVDDLFGFGENYGRRHPVFSRYPIAYNTIVNHTGWYTDSIYVLAASATGDFTMCALKASLTTKCSTRHHASLSGGSMSAHCEDPKDDLAYGKSYENATDGVIKKDWAAVATDWSLALSLNNGISDGAASNARLLSQLIPTSQALDPSLPSIAEALAVLSGSTLLLSSTDSPFIHFWNYSTTVPYLTEPQYQGFRATLRSRDYASGGTQRWQGIFYVILFLTFATNVFCLSYFLVRRGLVTDFIEPQNLFSLSLNSPPSQALDGACGGGPEGDQLIMNWHIKLDHEREHFYLQNGAGPPSRNRRPTRPVDFEMDTSPIVNAYTKLSDRHSSIL